MRIPQLLLGLTLALAALLLLVGLTPEAPGAGPMPHPGHPGLLVGGDGARDPWVLGIGWAFGALQIAFFAACFALGLRRPAGLGPIARPLWIGWIVHEGLWSVVVASYAWTAGDPDAALWASFPLPTAWTLFALGPFPLWFGAVYLLHFEAWVLNDGQMERFRARLAELARTRG